MSGLVVDIDVRYGELPVVQRVHAEPLKIDQAMQIVVVLKDFGERLKNDSTVRIAVLNDALKCIYSKPAVAKTKSGR